MHLRDFPELGQALVLMMNMTRHRQIGAIDLQREARLANRLVFGAHRVGQRENIFLMIAVEGVAEEK